MGVLALAAYYWWYEPWGHPVRGVDVSRHQGNIDWYALAIDPNVNFAYIKATEGGDWTDPDFALNWDQSRHVRLPRGAYHFFTLCRPVEDQIAHIIKAVPTDPKSHIFKGFPAPTRHGIVLPLAIALEFGGNCKGRPPVAQFRVDLTRMLDALEAHYGLRPILYLTREFDEAYMAGAFASTLR